ncbi:unnamed protein product [Gulo gulo]|uniref:MHC class I-like antigen recognition-like domain-containing protein n=1 Tax=Gulo gulo TaxID=48420 RepID=A0A9X9PYD1_GULGU|nr:unnamed protein product [Gulo gulo]
MLFLKLVLLVVLLPDGDSEDDFPDTISFRIILTTSFYNHSWTQNQGSAWLDEIQTHAWDSKTGVFLFPQPWSKGNFSKKELTEVEKLFYTYSIRSPSTYHNHISQWQLECEFNSLRGLGWISLPGSAGVRL